MLQQDETLRNQGDTDPVQQAPPAKNAVLRVQVEFGRVKQVRLQLFDRQKGDA